MFGGVCVDRGLTEQVLRVSVSELHTESNQTVMMRCARCGETFQREYKLRHKRHHCVAAGTGRLQYLKDWLADRVIGLADHVVRLEIQRCDPEAILPTRTRSTDAGYDLYTITTQMLNPGDVHRFETGLKIAAPDGWYYTIEGRSSLWTRGIVPFRGVIDGGYVGLIGAHLMNVSSQSYEINKGDRVAQIILHRVRHADLVLVGDFSPEYNHRGSNGFGSTGR